jgi:hypothetical protein
MPGHDAVGTHGCGFIRLSYVRGLIPTARRAWRRRPFRMA